MAAPASAASSSQAVEESAGLNASDKPRKATADDVISPNTKRFLELLMRKLEKNLRNQYKEEILSLKTEVNMLKLKVHELELAVKKNTPIATGAPLMAVASPRAGQKPSSINASGVKVIRKKKKGAQTVPGNASGNSSGTTSAGAKSPPSGLSKPDFDYARVDKLLQEEKNAKSAAKKKSKIPSYDALLVKDPDESEETNEIEVDDEAVKRPVLGGLQSVDVQPYDTGASSTGSGKKRASTPSGKRSSGSTKKKSPRKKSVSGSRRKSSQSGRKSPRGSIGKKKKSGGILKSTSSSKSFIAGMKITKGNRYLLKDDRYGICKYFNGTTIGIDLELGSADSKGEWNGKKRFDAGPNGAVFVTIDQIQMDCGVAN